MSSDVYVDFNENQPDEDTGNWIDSDSTEGRGRDFVCARFFTRVEAVKFAKGKDVMGSDGRVKPGKVLEVVENGKTLYFPVGEAVWVYGDASDKARYEALAKLTPEERKLLNLPINI